MVKDSLFTAISYFSHNVTFPRSCGKSYIVLIPKRDYLNKMTDYRSMSFCNVFYKIMSKFLTYRLKRVIYKLLRPEQVGFLAGRFTFDSILAVQEIV